jgi:Ca-activated chloride channel family protein
LVEEDRKQGKDLDNDLDDGKSVYRAYAFNPWVVAATNAFSTFAIDVDSASYTQARNFIRSQQLPPADAVRTEEFLNFFNYQYAPPVGNTFAVHLEAAPTPFGDGHLLKVGVKGKRLGRDQQRAARLTFCVDASGSMDTDDRIGLIRSSLTRLADQLGDDDEVAIVYYGSKAHLLLEHTSDKEKIREAIKAIPIGGSTHLEEGLKLAYETASGEFDSRNENRVLLLSDGAANLGAASAGEILEQVGGFRQQGISCSVFGFGIGTYNDTMLETLANKGDGSYQFIDSEEESQRVFVTELAATLSTIASDVKIQVEFNPDRVREFRQVGYENRQLKKEDFRNDTVDAGEVGSGQSVTALYEVGLQGEGNQEVGVVRIRFRNLDGEVEEMVHPIRASDVRSTFDGASVQFRLAASVAEFSEILRGSPFADGSQYSEVVPVLRPVVQELHLDSHVQELLQLVQAAAHGLPRAE